MTNPEHPSHLIVEIGCGYGPFPLLPHGRQLGPGQEYRGYDIELDKRLIAPYNAHLQDMLRTHGASGAMERGDARHLPLDEHMADEVVLVNVLSAPQFPRAEAIAEIRRILRIPSGLVTIVETYSPNVVPLEQARFLLGTVGLHQQNVGSEHDLNAINQYSESFGQNRPYIGIFGFSQ